MWARYREKYKKDLVPDVKAITEGEMQMTAMNSKCLLEKHEWELRGTHDSAMNTNHDGIKWTEQKDRRPIINLTNKNLCPGYWQEKQNKDISVKNFVRGQ